MENQALKSEERRTSPVRRRGAADLCRGFMESEGWAILFAFARGEPQRAIVRSRITGKAAEVKVTPDIDQRATAIKIITAYGYGRPAELARADDSGRTVTDLLLEAFKQQSSNEPTTAGPE